MIRLRTPVSPVTAAAARAFPRRLPMAMGALVTTVAALVAVGLGVGEGWEAVVAGPGVPDSSPRTEPLVYWQTPRLPAIAIWPDTPDRAAPPFGRPVMGDATRTCRRSNTHHVATRASECTLWEVSGPVNFVITTGGPPLLAALGSGGWQPARGEWLVAQGSLDHDSGCASGWRDSREQLELRIGPTSRRHIKLIHVDCPGGAGSTAFGDAHTDAYDLRRCGGDRTVDVDAAREALVQSLQHQPHVTVSYRRMRPKGTQYRAGCGQLVTTDGMGAYINIGPGGV